MERQFVSRILFTDIILYPFLNLCLLVVFVGAEQLYYLPDCKAVSRIERIFNMDQRIFLIESVFNRRVFWILDDKNFIKADWFSSLFEDSKLHGVLSQIDTPNLIKFSLISNLESPRALMVLYVLDRDLFLFEGELDFDLDKNKWQDAFVSYEANGTMYFVGNNQKIYWTDKNPNHKTETAEKILGIFSYKNSTYIYHNSEHIININDDSPNKINSTFGEIFYCDPSSTLYPYLLGAGFGQICLTLLLIMFTICTVMRHLNRRSSKKTHSSRIDSGIDSDDSLVRKNRSPHNRKKRLNLNSNSAVEKMDKFSQTSNAISSSPTDSSYSYVKK